MNNKILLDTDIVHYAFKDNLLLPKDGYAISIVTKISLGSTDKSIKKFLKTFKISIP